MLSIDSIVRFFFFFHLIMVLKEKLAHVSENFLRGLQIMWKMLLIAYSKANSFYRATFIPATSDRVGWHSAHSHPWLEWQEGLESAPRSWGKVQTQTCSEKSWLPEVRFPCGNGRTQAPVEVNHPILQEVRKSMDLLPKVPHLLSPPV